MSISHYPFEYERLHDIYLIRDRLRYRRNMARTEIRNDDCDHYNITTCKCFEHLCTSTGCDGYKKVIGLCMECYKEKWFKYLARTWIDDDGNVWSLYEKMMR